MEIRLFNSKLLLCKSVLLSLLLHWAVFNNVILVFPTMAEPHKPKLIFLGSILQSSDMKSSLVDHNTEAGELKNLSKIQNSINIYSGSINKPPQHKSYDPKSKRTLKSVEAPEIVVEEMPDPIELNDFNIEREVEPYKPLRLKDHD